MSVGFIKINIFFNFFILILLSSIILIEFLIKIQKKKEFQSKIEIKKFLFSSCKNKIGTNKWLIVTLIFATILSIFRAIFVDPPIVVTDNYDLYAEQIKILLIDFNYDIENNLLPTTKNRIVYSLLVAILSLTFPFLDIITLGKIITYLSFLFSCFFLNKILNLYKTTSKQVNKIRILTVFALNPAILTHLIRFETDILFLAISLFFMYLYINCIRNGFTKLRLVKIVLSIPLLVFTREIGIILLISFIIHYFFIQSKKIKIIIIVLTGLILLVLIYLDLMAPILFNFIYVASKYNIAYRIVYLQDYSDLLTNVMNKFTNEYTFLKTIESLVYSFFPLIIFSFVGFIFLLKNKKVRNKIISNPLAFYLVITIIIYLFFKAGEDLDRYWIPILPIPLLILPYTVNIHSFLKNLKNKIIISKENLKSRNFLPQEKEVEEKNLIKNNSIIKNQEYSDIFPLSTMIFIISIQLVIFFVRTILAFFDFGI